MKQYCGYKGSYIVSDPEQAHDGAIYQATNWIYQGCGDFQMAPTYSLRLKEDGDWIK